MTVQPPLRPRTPERGAMPPPRRGVPIVAWAAVTCALAVAALVVLARTALMTSQGQDIDQSAMEAVYAREGTRETLLSMLGEVSIGTTAAALLVCVLLALTRRRYAVAVAAVVLVAGANITTQVLKRWVLERPELGQGVLENSLPSGHTTVVVSVTLASLLVGGRALRPFLAGLGGLAVTMTGASTLVAGWHRPSDVLSGLAVSLAWGAIVVLVLAVRRPTKMAGAPWAEAAAATFGAVLSGVVLVVLGVRPDGGWTGVVDAALVLSALGLGSVVTIAAFAPLSSAHGD